VRNIAKSRLKHGAPEGTSSCGGKNFWGEGGNGVKLDGLENAKQKGGEITQKKEEREGNKGVSW